MLGTVAVPSDPPDGCQAAVAAAVAARQRWQEARLLRLDEDAVAELATFLVAAWLGDGARVIDDDAAGWDVDWRCGDRLVQVRVACCATADDAVADANGALRWDLGPLEPAGGDVIVLVRHDGERVDEGWRFWVLPAETVEGRQQVTARQLAVHGAIPVAGADLAAAVLASAEAPPIS